jgi:hypothetical protein
MLISGFELARRRRAGRVLGAGERAAQESRQQRKWAEQAAQQGDASAFHAAAERAILAQLEARLGESVASLTRPQLSETLAERGMKADLAADVTGTLERSEFARFASGADDDSALREHAAALGRLLEQVAGFTPEQRP